MDTKISIEEAEVAIKSDFVDRIGHGTFISKSSSLNQVVLQKGIPIGRYPYHINPIHDLTNVFFSIRMLHNIQFKNINC